MWVQVSNARMFNPPSHFVHQAANVLASWLSKPHSFLSRVSVLFRAVGSVGEWRVGVDGSPPSLNTVSFCSSTSVFLAGDDSAALVPRHLWNGSVGMPASGVGASSRVGWGWARVVFLCVGGHRAAIDWQLLIQNSSIPFHLS